VAEAAKRCGQYYVNFRWLGGMLTNWKTVSQSIKTLRGIELKLSGDDNVEYNKKERLDLERQRLKLEQALGGIKNMGGYPDLVFIIDINKEEIALKEAIKLGVPIMAVVDTNCNPDDVSYVIPGNDDSTKAIKLFCNLIADAAIAGTRENMAASGVDLGSTKAGELPEFALNKDKKADRKPAVKAQGESEEKKREKKKIIFEAKPQEAVLEENKEEKKKPAAKKPAGKKPAKAADKK
jgi:small subunit ribosomal protein S2